MKSFRTLSLALAFASIVTAASAATPSKATGQLVPVTDKDAAWVAEQKAKYPTNLCVVSDDKLGGDMGKPADYIYRVAGKPDRLISFCCKDCVADFNKDPEKYVAMLDKAAAKKGEAKKSDGHTAHQH
jgi:YHS domain-containing protein